MKSNEPINPIIWDSRHNPTFELSNEGLDLRTHMAIEFTKAYIIAGCGTDKTFIGNAIAGISQADALIESLNK